MKIQRLNREFITKRLAKEPEEISTDKFWESYVQEGRTAKRVESLPKESPAPSSPSSVVRTLTNNPIDPVSTLLGKPDLQGQEINAPLDLSAFGVTYNLEPGLQPFGGTQEDIIVTSPELPADTLGELPTTPIINVLFDFELPTVEDIGCVYNFYIKEYEDVTSAPDFSELAMLNSYGTVLNLEGLITGPNTSPGEMLNPSVLRFDGAGNRLAFNMMLDQNTPFSTVKNYYRNYAVNVQEYGPGAFGNYENIFYPAGSISSVNSSVDLLVDTVPSERGGGFVPYYIGLEISKARSSGPLVAAFEDADMANSLMAKVLATMDNSQAYDTMVFYPSSFDVQTSYPAKVWELGPLLDGAPDPTAVIGLPAVVMGTVDDVSSTFPELEPSFGTYTNELEFLQRLYSVISDNYRDWSEMNIDATCYSEIVMYRLAKFENDNDSKPIQNFFFFNDSNAEVFKFIDTQVKVDKDYVYKLYSYSVALTNEYIQETANSSSEAAQVVVQNAQRIKLIEVLAFQTRTFVSSKPPLFPETSIRGYLGDDRRINITMNQQMGFRVENPVTFTEEERQRAERLRTAQSRTPSQPLEFRDDDISKVYEIFRTTVAPDSVMSFQNSLWRRVTESSVIDNVIADQTYYYMFRTIDAHGNISNPSPALEVTLVGGFSPYLIVNEYDYEQAAQKNKSKTKEMRRFLRIRPTVAQLMARQEFEGMNSSRDVESPRLSVVDDGTVWTEKFKVRLTSKETGRKIDYNIEYDYNFEPREE
tara:strand:- start:44 stop:2317 length:2274 start_codon:yes stop_codon:yes gene_type:complete